MSESKLFVTNGFGGGVSAGIRGDNYAEFEALAKQVYGEAAGAQFARDAFDSLRSQVSPAAAAIGALDQAVGVQSVSSGVPHSTVGTATAPVAPPVAQPTVPQPAAQGQVIPFAPPGIAYPGDCAHGQRVYKDKPAQGRPWVRWECAQPFSQETKATRCKAINI